MHQISKTMKNFYDAESLCRLQFSEMGDCFHLWTPENFTIIFTCDEDFKAGMGIIGIAAKLFPDVTIITFEIMSNHLHITAAGEMPGILAMFDAIRKMLMKYVQTRGRHIDWSEFNAGTRKLQTLEDVRNVIVYNNKNGFVVNPSHTPFTYPWGANRYFFNPDAKALALSRASKMTYRQRRSLSHSHASDESPELLMFEGYALPLSFCDIASGEKMFRNASHYFGKLSRSIESSREIAKEIGESVFYNDDDLFAAVCEIVAKMYPGQGLGKTSSPTLLPAQAKIELAKTMHYDYNATRKQIMRMLKIEASVLDSLGLR